jgi:hypothetical protein
MYVTTDFELKLIVYCASIVTCISARSQMTEAFLPKCSDQFETYSFGMDQPKEMDHPRCSFGPAD